jgi:hypothetical protein
MESARIQKITRRWLTLAFHFSAFFLSFTAHAARPFFTDDARVVDQGGCQVESFYKKQRTYDGHEFWFLPACNPAGLELTVGGNRIEGDDSLVLQAKALLKPLQTNGSGYAISGGFFGGDPYVNLIASYSYFNDRSVVHLNTGAIRDEQAQSLRNTWGVGLEQLLFAPRLYGILETFGQSGDKATLHYGLRVWIVPNRFQIDATHGDQPDGHDQPARHFNSIGVRILW